MADEAVPYPPAPANVPPDLTTPTLSYRLRVLVVLSSLFLFASLYLGLVVGSAYLCYQSFAALIDPNPYQGTRLAPLQDVSRTEERLTQTYNDAVRQGQQRQISDDQFVRVLERDVLPPWRAEIQRLTQLNGLSGEEQRIVDAYRRSLQLQEESWTLLCRAIRQHDRDLVGQAQQKAQQSEALGRQVSADANRYFSDHAPRSGDWEGWNIIAGILSGLLCLFLVKGFFKWRRADRAQRLEITEKDQPVLFAFIHRVCRDTRAPRPHRVYLTPDVNAAVFYHESLLSLFLPTPKNLLIGLGLVNQLNLSEFKAVLAHEFGHFSQKSMKLGGYVYTANRVIADIVFGRDWVDDTVDSVRRLRWLSGARVDVRVLVLAFVVAGFAWAFSGALWVLRKTLQGLFRLINFANSSLSRQMEFNADLVAVSVTGSDALIHGLARLDLATEALGQAWNDVTGAADRGLYTRDLFYHQTRAADYLRGQRKDPALGQPPALPEDPRQVVQVFQPEDTRAPKMWATHPSNYDREVNAKHYYVRSPLDERSPWVLFRDAAAVREKVTHRLYQQAGRPEGLTLQAPEVVQAFIDEEHAETTYHARYQGLYDHRYLTPGDLDELIRAAPAEFTGPDRLAEAHARLYGDELKARTEAHRSRQEEYQRVAPLAHGAVELTGKDFSFRGARYRAADAKRLLEQVKKELDEDYEWMARLDRQAFLVHDAMARQVGDDARRELEERYRFHLAVQECHGLLSAHNRQVRATLDRLAGRREITREEFHGTLAVLGQAHDALRQVLEAASGLRLPPLKNVTPGEILMPLLLSGQLIGRLSAASNSLDGKWIGRFLEQLGEVIDKAQRIHFKSLGGILALQEKLGEQWLASGRCPAQAAGVGD
jgi:Zn-dependent protease with chaperone function